MPDLTGPPETTLPAVYDGTMCSAGGLSNAENGYPVSSRVGSDWADAVEKLSKNPAAEAAMLPNGRRPCMQTPGKRPAVMPPSRR